MSISEGVRRERIVEEIDLDSVPEMFETGRTITSNVALDACSDARRTSTGPETDAIDNVSPKQSGKQGDKVFVRLKQTKRKASGTINSVETFI